MKENQKTIEVWEKEIKEMDEVSLFVTIDTFSILIWRESCNFAEGRTKVSQQTFLNHQNYYVTLVNLCICKLSDFGVNFQSDKPCSESDSYMEWYSFWKNWMKSFTDENWKMIQKKLQDGQSIEELLPKTKWNQTVLEEKINELKELLDLDQVPIVVSALSTSGWSDEEVVVILRHFMEGGMLSEIIAPPKGYSGYDSIIKAEETLRDFDQFFYAKVAEIPGLKDRLISIWARKK